MAEDKKVVITGASGYTGKYITRRLLAAGKKVLTLTGHTDRDNPFNGKIEVAPFNFENPRELVKSLEGTAVLYNTYWVRFSYKNNTYERAVENTKILARAAKDAGVRRIVHVSITNPSENSLLPYFKGKAELEKFIMQSGLSYAIIRPTVIFGVEDILVNNIAWLLRKFPVFPVLGNGKYKLQPIFVEDMADIVVDAGKREDSFIVDAVGPDIFTFNELVKLLRNVVRSHAIILHIHPELALALSQFIGIFVNDVVLTKDEVKGLMADLLISDKPPTGKTHLADWLEENTNSVGIRYASELQRHFR